MPASPLETARLALVALLQSADGNGSYTNDLSSAVYEGAPPDGFRQGLEVYVWCERVRYETSPLVPLGDFVTVQEVDIMGAVPGGDTPAARVRAAERLGQDLFLAIRTDRDLGDTVRDVRVVEITQIDGNSIQMGERLGVVLMRVEIAQDQDGVA